MPTAAQAPHRAVFKWHTHNGTDRHVCTIVARGHRLSRVIFDREIRMPGGRLVKAGEETTVPSFGLCNTTAG